MGFTWPDVLTGLIEHEPLSRDAAAWAMGSILAGEATPTQVAGFMVALRAKGESPSEVSALADAMLARATPIELDRESVDVVGSGGDRANTVNISTMAAIVAAAAGAKVAKHGNRAASSACGTADVLEALGIPLDVPPAAQRRVQDEVGIVFLFAPFYHPSLRHAAVARRELGVKTTFNFLGPLANPARPLAQAVGVADVRMAELMATVFTGRGARGVVFHGADGLDELTTTTVSDVWIFADGDMTRTTLDPARLGLAPATRESLVGGDAAFNARVVRSVMAGDPGPVRDIVLLNAAAALLAYDGPTSEPLTDQLADRLSRAAVAIDTGAATTLLERWTAASLAAKG